MTGFINVDKPQGKSSAYAVNVIKRLTHEKVGHMGTLDPMATGVLPIAVGNATRLFDFFLEKRKRYIATFRFGMDTDTLDTTGAVLKKGGFVPSVDEVNSVLGEFIGELDQIPPNYSAKNVDGKRSYTLAREGKEFVLPPKKVSVYSIKLINSEGSLFTFDIECGGGTYIRALARDIGKRLSTCAVMSALRRVESGNFKIDKSVALDSLKEENVKEYIIPVQDVLPFESFSATRSDERKLLNGLAVESNLPDGIYKFFLTDGSFYGLVEEIKNKVKVRTKLC